MINVLVIEDDPMVSKLNQSYVNEVEGFRLAGAAYTYAEAAALLEQQKVDLILLDIYIGAKNGLDLLKNLRTEQNWNGDAILITAASDVQSVQTAMRHGAVDYIMKPFDFPRFQQALLSYKEKHILFQAHDTLDQKKLDERFFALKESAQIELPKGLSTNTLRTIVKTIESLPESAFSSEHVAEKSSISTVSVRKYLKFLAEAGVLGERVTYGSVGRPLHLYVIRKENLLLIDHLL
ncbi:response regulator [Jeotgalibacillus proteolyticus]|uniref:Transcriptional regulatory protein n=1 Tax=Jeotgalibacillus proteolyticus TaxID=2082395 RepID=A0A2S5GDG7_9BACL|nr:response regulator [Jeotgalibacillus proteolyticus]PPA71036.1 two-component system response regulator DcuR [Jeotgalibacillus proteolyticus]